jgi:hypothetical protein
VKEKRKLEIFDFEIQQKHKQFFNPPPGGVRGAL